MSDVIDPPPSQPVLVRIVVVIVYLSGFASVAIGIFVLLSRYRVEADQVLPVSLLGAAIILFGLLTVAVASGVARGRRLARLLLTLYLGAQFLLHLVTILSTDEWDWTATAGIIVLVFIVNALWTPPGSRYFRAVAAAQADREASAA
jgi:hypothetical protein